MRRRDREITDLAKIEEILKKARVLRLGLWDGEYPYVVPLHYGYALEDGKLDIPPFVISIPYCPTNGGRFIFKADYKVFNSGRFHFGVGQGSYMSEKNRQAAEALLAPYLETERVKQNLDYVFYLFTDVRGASSDLLMTGKGAEAVVERAFGAPPENGKAVLPGVVSRKKQLIPALLPAMRQE